MVKLRHLSQRYPIPFVLLFAIVFFAVMFGVGHLENFLFPQNNIVSALFIEIIDMLYPVGLAVLAGYGFSIKEKGFGKTFKAGLAVFCAYVLLLLMRIFGSVGEPGIHFAPVHTMLLGVLILIGVGVREEFIYRSVVTNVLALKYGRSAKGLWFTTIVSGLVFGFVHMANMFSGAPFAAALIQSLGAAGTGMIFAAIYLRGGNIWFLVLLHGIIDSIALFPVYFLVFPASAPSHTTTDVISRVDPWGAIMALSSAVVVMLVLLRKSKHQEIFDRLDALRTKLELQ